MKTVEDYRTYKKAITVHGKKRKMDRLIAQFVLDNHPTIYAKAYTHAHKVVAADDADPMSEIVDVGLGCVHEPSAMLIHMKQQQQQAILEKLAETEARHEQTAGNP